MEAGWRLSEEIEWSTDASLSQGWCNDASLLGSIITAENWVCPSIKALIPSPTPNMLWQRRIFPSARPVSPHTSRVDVCDWQFYYSWVRWVWSGYIFMVSMSSMHLNVLKLGTTTSSVLIEKSVHVRLVKKKKKKIVWKRRRWEIERWARMTSWETKKTVRERAGLWALWHILIHRAASLHVHCRFSLTLRHWLFVFPTQSIPSHPPTAHSPALLSALPYLNFIINFPHSVHASMKTHRAAVIHVVFTYKIWFMCVSVCVCSCMHAWIYRHKYY